MSIKIANERARLWYLTAPERRRGVSLVWDTDKEVWIKAGQEYFDSDKERWVPIDEER